MTDTSTTDTKKIAKKISALLAKARGTTNEHEAAAFMAKVEALMAEHQIEAYELGDGSDPMGREELLHSSIAAPVWRTTLPRAIARYYGCKTVRSFKAYDGTTNHKYVVFLLGRESARVTTALMTPFIIEQVNAEAAKCASEMRLPKDKAALRIANALVTRIHVEADKREAEQAREAATTTAMSIAKNALVVKDEVESFMYKEFPDISMAKGKAKVTNNVAREAAARVSLHRQATGTGATLRIQGR